MAQSARKYPVTSQPTALVSIHDVMPENLPQVARILDLLERLDVHPVTLLVVPGLAWDEEGLQQLRQWHSAGCELAGHGWTHRAARIGSLYHKVHSTLLSRNVAEHLALDAAGIERLIRDCHAWFADRGLPEPGLYVPPAWAMGAIRRSAFRDLPFRYYETLTGARDTDSGRFQSMPVIGFEADTRLRAIVLRISNAVNLLRIRLTKQPLRIAIHPHDLDYLLAPDVERLLRKAKGAMGARFVSYSEAMPG